MDIRSFGGPGEKGLETDTDPEERFAGFDVFVQGGEVACLAEGGETVPEVADSGEDDLLGRGDVGGRADPADFVAAFFDGVDEGADVAGDVV